MNDTDWMAGSVYVPHDEFLDRESYDRGFETMQVCLFGSALLDTTDDTMDTWAITTRDL